MLFSATLNAWVKNLAWEYTKSPWEIEIEPETVTVEEIEQILYHVHSDDKMKFLLGVLDREKPESAIIFCNTKKYTEIVARRLEINGIECEFIMGDLPQSKRLKIIEDVKAGKTRFLVATDVAARGLDIDDLAMVINYDLPIEAENYVHRIGRTARAGKFGKAVSLVSEQDVYELPDIERFIGKKIPSFIADESFYGEDKSEGIRIRTDSYDDRGRRDSRGRDSRRTGPVARHGEKRRREGSPAVSPRRSGPRPRPERPHGEAGHGEGCGVLPRNPKRRDAAELASLSQEERMAYYKQRYENPIQSSGGSGQKPGDRQPREGGNRRRGRARRPAEQLSGQAQQPGQRTQTPAVSQTGGEGKAKNEKGLLSKILGIFRKG
jgi:ATP-dependent RNA helicase RhlB